MTAISEEPVVRTRCSNCAFAIMEDGLQQSCQLGRIDRFREQNVEYFHDEDNYYNIPRYCNAARNQAWLKDHQDNPIEEVYKEIAIKVGVVIYMDSNNLDNLIVTLNSLTQQILRPKSVVVVLQHARIAPFNLMKVMDDTLSSTGIKWSFEKIIDSEMTKWACLDKGVLRVNNYNRFAVFNAGYKVHPCFFSRLNSSLNVDMKRWVLLEPKDTNYNGLVSLTKLHEAVGGFGTMGFVEKVRNWESEHKTTMIVKPEELDV